VLLNVLAGTMSLVGPRLRATEDAERDSSALPFVKERKDLRPGIVGWAELNCGSDDDELGARENLQYDLYYLKNHTLLLDLAILVHAAQMLVLKGS
jgi:lipopolysaccharide/colanic/teichoic acid biosynthesis glycosyltransferase